MSNYQRTVLESTELFEVVSIEWTSESISHLHSHDWSQCMVLIQEGTFENHLDLGLKTELQILEPGQVVNTPVGAKHKMRCLSPKGRTFHVYVPKIKEASRARFHVPSLQHLKEEIRLSQATNIEPLRKVLGLLREHSITSESPYFMNQLFSGISPSALLTQELLAQTKTTLATLEASPAFSAIEVEVVEALGSLIGWPSGAREGVNVPGGSAANFMAIHCARQRQFPEYKKNGLQGEKLKVFVSSEAHYSFKKACVVLGLGSEAVIAVPVDSAGRMQVSALDALLTESKKRQETPLLVCATAGTTVLGAFDPIDQIAAVCKKQELWLHVDGAWGGPALFSHKMKPAMKGIELADSVAFDAHKLFGAELTCSFFLTRHRKLLLEANDVSGADYLFHSDESVPDRGKLSWQCGRGADALSFWAIWKNLGTAGLGQFVDRLIGIREQTLEWMKTQPRLELIANPQFLNICVRVVPPHSPQDSATWSRKVREALKEKNLAMVNFSGNEQGSFLRLVLSHPYLQFDHVKQILEWALEVK